MKRIYTRELREDNRCCFACRYIRTGYDINNERSGIHYCEFPSGKKKVIRIVKKTDACEHFERGVLEQEIADVTDWFRLIPLSCGRFVWVDKEDYPDLIGYNWTVLRGDRSLYAVRRRKNGKVVLMHRELMKPGRGMVVDHINHRGLDNRRFNLRVCSSRQNSMNRRGKLGSRSKYKGLSWMRDLKKWSVKIQGRFVGCFEDETEAARAYDAAAREVFGEYACLNFAAETED